MTPVEHRRGPWSLAITLAMVAVSAGCSSPERSHAEVPSAPSAPAKLVEAEAEPSTPRPNVEPAPVAPAPALDPPPAITTDIDPSIFQWAHPTDENAALELVIHLGAGDESERWRRLARAQEGRSSALADVGIPERFARGDTWLIFAPDEPAFTAKVRGFWPSLDDEDTVTLLVLLGRAPEGLAVRPRNWKGRRRPAVRWDRSLAADDPVYAEITERLRRVPEAALVAELVERGAPTLDELQVWPGRFVGGTHLACIEMRVEGPGHESVAGVLLLDLVDGRTTPIVPLERSPRAGHGIGAILDLDGDGYEEAIVERAGDSGVYEHLLYWREGRPVLEPLVHEDA